MGNSLKICTLIFITLILFLLFEAKGFGEACESGEVTSWFAVFKDPSSGKLYLKLSKFWSLKQVATCENDRSTPLTCEYSLERLNVKAPVLLPITKARVHCLF